MYALLFINGDSGNVQLSVFINIMNYMIHVLYIYIYSEIHSVIINDLIK